MKMRSQALLMIAILSAAVVCTRTHSIAELDAGLASEELGSSVDCHMFSCMESIKRCGKSGFFMGFGYQICNTSSLYKEHFTQKGSEWLKDVQICILKEMQMALSNKNATCHSLMEDGLLKFGQCYQSAHPDVCSILQHKQNHQALVRVFNVSNLPGSDGQYLIHQITDIARSCLYFKYNKSLGSVDDVRRNMRIFISAAQTTLPRVTVKATEPRSMCTLDKQCQDLETTCLRYAKEGDCRFLECFEKKFPCGAPSLFSHVMHFELPLCYDVSFNVSMSSSHEAREWSLNYHKCMFSELLMLYKQDTVSCDSLQGFFSDKRPVCMISPGMCLIKPQEFYLIIDQTTYFEEHLHHEPLRVFLKCIRKLRQSRIGCHIFNPEYYYRNLVLFKASFLGTLCQCGTEKYRMCLSLYPRSDRVVNRHSQRISEPRYVRSIPASEKESRNILNFLDFRKEKWEIDILYCGKDVLSIENVEDIVTSIVGVGSVQKLILRFLDAALESMKVLDVLEFGIAEWIITGILSLESGLWILLPIVIPMIPKIMKIGRTIMAEIDRCLKERKRRILTAPPPWRAPRLPTPRPKQGSTTYLSTAPTEQESTAIVTTSTTEQESTAIVTTGPTEQELTTVVSTAPTEQESTAIVTTATTEQELTTIAYTATTAEDYQCDPNGDEGKPPLRSLRYGCTTDHQVMVEMINDRTFLEAFLNITARGYTVLKAAIMCNREQIIGVICRNCKVLGQRIPRHAEENLKLHVMYRLDRDQIRQRVGEHNSHCEFWTVINNQPCVFCSGANTGVPHMLDIKTYMRSTYPGLNTFRLAWANFYPRLKLDFADNCKIKAGNIEESKNSYRSLVTRRGKSDVVYNVHICAFRREWFENAQRGSLDARQFESKRKRQTHCELKKIGERIRIRFRLKEDCLYDTDATLTVDRQLIGALWP